MTPTAGLGPRTRGTRRPAVPPTCRPGRCGAKQGSPRRGRAVGPVVVIALALSTLIFAAVSSATGLLAAALGAPPAQLDPDAELASARAAYEAALEDRDLALAVLRDASDRAVALETQLRELGGRQRQSVLDFEAQVSLARRLAVDAYVRGGQSSDLYDYLDASEATEAALRMHLTLGRVDRARDAAEALRLARSQVDTSVVTTALAVADAVEALQIADRAATRADAVVAETYERAVAAEAAVAAAEAARVEAERQAAAEAAAEAEAADNGGDGGDGGDDEGSTAPQTPLPPPEYRDGSDGWAKLRECESGGNYRAVSPGGLYRGAYQFAQETWESVGGTGDPAAASPEEQDLRARILYELSGNSPWPVCGRFLP